MDSIIMFFSSSFSSSLSLSFFSLIHHLFLFFLVSLYPPFLPPPLSFPLYPYIGHPNSYNHVFILYLKLKTGIYCEKTQQLGKYYTSTPRKVPLPRIFPSFLKTDYFSYQPAGVAHCSIKHNDIGVKWSQ